MPIMGTSELDHLANVLAARPGRASLCRDPVEASAQLRGAYSEHRLQVLGPVSGFEMNFVRHSLGPVALDLLAFGTEVELRQEPAGRFTLVSTQLQGQTCVRRQGCEKSGGEGWVVWDAADQPVVKRFSTDSRRLNLRIDHATLHAKHLAWCGAVRNPGVGQGELFLPGSQAHRRWMAWLGFVLNCLSIEPEAVPKADGVPHGAWFSPIVEAGLLLLLHEAMPEHRIDANQARAIAPRHLRRAEEFIRAHAQQPLTLEAIASAAGVSIRTLTESFRRVRETTPMAMLREQRLLGARAELLRADGSATVTGVALQWGFLNVGRFSAAYRARFGERPSDSLRSKV